MELAFRTILGENEVGRLRAIDGRNHFLASALCECSTARAIGLINDLIILTLIVSGLLVYDTFVFGSVLALCFAGSLFIRWTTKDRMAEYSGIRKLVDPRMNTTLNNAIRGVLELLAFGGIKHVQDKYMRDAKLGFRVMSNAAILGALPHPTV